MTPVQIEQARALGRCTFTPGSAAKRFARWASDLARTKSDHELSPKAAAFLNRLAHSYRRQIGRCLAIGCERCKP